MSQDRKEFTALKKEKQTNKKSLQTASEAKGNFNTNFKTVGYYLSN